MMRRSFYLIGLLSTIFLFLACEHSPKKITVAASCIPHAEILEQVKEPLKKEGITLVITEVEDYALPNRLLEEKVIDANFFQHIPFLEKEKKNFGYDITWIAKVHIEPLGIYSNKFTSLEEIPDKAVVALPSDPSNESRALVLLEKEGLISLKPSKNGFFTLLDVEQNPKNLKLEELDAALLVRALHDVDLSVIPGNYILKLKKNHKTALLALESKNSDYVNILAIRSSDGHREELKRLAELLNSEEIRTFIKEKFQGQIIPAF